jgi:hypothetical protein
MFLGCCAHLGIFAMTDSASGSGCSRTSSSSTWAGEVLRVRPGVPGLPGAVTVFFSRGRDYLSADGRVLVRLADGENYLLPSARRKEVPRTRTLAPMMHWSQGRLCYATGAERLASSGLAVTTHDGGEVERPADAMKLINTRGASATEVRQVRRLLQEVLAPSTRRAS